MRRWFFVGFFAFFLAGCSAEHWRAQYYLFRAESEFEHTDSKLRIEKKLSYDELKPHYQKACEKYVKAYILDPEVFFLYHIQHGTDACWRAADSFNQEKLERFEKEYIKSHPKEAEYGDMGIGAFSDV